MPVVTSRRGGSNGTGVPPPRVDEFLNGRQPEHGGQREHLHDQAELPRRTIQRIHPRAAGCLRSTIAGSTNNTSPENAITCSTARPAAARRAPSSARAAAPGSRPSEQSDDLASKPRRSQPHHRRRGGHQHEVDGQRDDDHDAERQRRERERGNGAPQPRPREIQLDRHAEQQAAARVEAPPAERAARRCEAPAATGRFQRNASTAPAIARRDGRRHSPDRARSARR